MAVTVQVFYRFTCRCVGWSYSRQALPLSAVHVKKCIQGGGVPMASQINSLPIKDAYTRP